MALLCIRHLFDNGINILLTDIYGSDTIGLYQRLVRTIYQIKEIWHFTINGEFNIADGSPTVFTDGDQHPSVDNGTLFMTSNTNPTTITDFDTEVEGQVIVIYFYDDDTTITHGTNIFLSGGANKNFAEKQSLVLMKVKFLPDPTTKWIQIGGEI